MLPKIDVPVFSINLISNGKEVKFRPFTVKEEKLFLMANESKDLKTIIDTTKQVLNNCIISEIDIDKLPIFDVEYLFLNIRARSVNEIINLNYKCNNDIKNEDDDETHKCGHTVQIDVNVLDIKPKNDNKVENRIEITDKVGLVMRYPNFNTIKKYDDENQSEMILKLTVDCIEYIYDGDQIYYAKDVSEEELIEFVENMQTKDLEKIKEYFENMPKISKDLDFKCRKCGYEERITIEGLESFFV
jgi:DNA-directed RNA polymerase subunit M/transcription elongation factor TFIIS